MKQPKRKSLLHLASLLACLALSCQYGWSGPSRHGVGGGSRLGLHSQRLSTHNGLGSNSVRATLQDQAGYLWVATDDGLSRYDGHHLINFVANGARTPGFVSSSVNSLCEDTLRHLLWVMSSSEQVACYDLRQGRFVDYLDSLPATAPLPEMFISASQVVLSGEHYGLRQVTFDGERPHARDFTEANGLLHHNRIRPVCCDRRGTLWLPTQCGLATLTPDGQLRYLEGEGVFRAVTTEGDKGDKVYVLDDSNTLRTYDLDGRCQSRIAIPRQLGATDRVWFHFWWRGKWVLLGREHTILFDPATGRCSAPQGWDVVYGKIVAQTDGYVWVTSDNRDLVVFRPDGQVRRLALLPQAILDMGVNARYSVARAAKGLFYIATNGNGLFRYDARTETLDHYTSADDDALLHSDYLLHAYCDRSGTLWLANELVGLTCVTPRREEVRTLLPDAAARRDRSNHIAVCQQLTDSTIAVSTRDGNLYIYNIRTRGLHHETHVAGSLYGLLCDSRGRLWLGTRGNGVIIDGRTYNPRTTPSCPSAYIYGMAEDSQGRVWISTLTDGLVCATTADDDSIAFARFPLTDAHARINAVTIDHQGYLWVGTANGLYIADTHKPQLRDEDFARVAWDGNTDHIVSLAPDEEGHVWIGTKHGGARRATRHADGSVELEAVVRSGNIMSVVPTPDGGAWLGTDGGILRWDARIHDISRRLTADDDLSNICVMGAAARTADGGCIFGTYYGLVLINDRQSPRANPAGSVSAGFPDGAPSSTPLITDILVADSSLAQACQLPEGTTDITLRHTENTLTIHFATLRFAEEPAMLYTYWLEGHEQQWSHTTATGEANYSDLPPGRYRFHVKVVDAMPGAAAAETVFAIRIRPPWWRTWWARLLYVIVTGIFAGTVFHQLRARNRLRSCLEIERRLARFRLDFFTQVCHELRTPLALIQSGVERLQADKTHPADASQLQVVGRGTGRLAKLVNQLLLFRRINEDSVRLSLAEADIVKLVRDVCDDFFHLAGSRGMSIQFTPFTRSHTMVFDANIVETIVYNLVSNAVKYTPVGGSIRVRIPAPEDGLLRISVFNSAQPLSVEQRAQLFKPYMHGYVSQGGMGIGLYVAHQLATLSHGDLTYAEADGGVLFTLTLPEEEREKITVNSEKQNKPDTDEGNSYFSLLSSSLLPPPAPPTPTQLLPRSVNSQRVCIVEDDTDMAEQLRQQVGVFFNVETYADGAEALQAILASPPDLVLCDIKLPSLDGYSIVRRLKESEATSHLPVILLTSLQDDAHHVRGIKSGADAFLTKPCNPEVLVNLMAQLMRRRPSRPTPGRPTPGRPTPAPSREGGERLRDENAAQTTGSHDNTHSQAGGLPSLTGGVGGGSAGGGSAGGGSADREVIQQLVQQFVETPTAEDTIVTSLADQRFREQATQLVAQNLASTDFNADALAQQMGIGRTVFFRRFKQLLGHSPSEYIRTERMRLAARLITEDKLNVAEVAQRTGFTDASHFIRAFKAFYGVTPTQFRQV